MSAPSHPTPPPPSQDPLLREYACLRSSVAVFDLTQRGRLCLTGQDRVRFLHGQVTQDIQSLALGQGAQAALVGPKGRMEALLWVYALPDELLLDFDPGQTDALLKRFDHYIVADDVQMTDATPYYGLWSLQGPLAGTLAAAVGLPAPTSAHRPAIHSIPHADWGDVYVTATDRCGEQGVDLYVPKPAMDAVRDALATEAVALHGCMAHPESWDYRRIEAGRPRFGVDLTPSNLAPEGGDAFVRQTIHYQKGCYIGQEIIARIRTYGQVTKALKGVFLHGCDGSLPPSGTRLYRKGKDVGLLTSVVQSPSLDRPIGLAVIRKECNQIGSVLHLDPDDGPRTAEITPLPFIPDASSGKTD